MNHDPKHCKGRNVVLRTFLLTAIHCLWAGIAADVKAQGFSPPHIPSVPTFTPPPVPAYTPPPHQNPAAMAAQQWQRDQQHSAELGRIEMYRDLDRIRSTAGAGGRAVGFAAMPARGFAAPGRAGAGRPVFGSTLERAQYQTAQRKWRLQQRKRMAALMGR